MMRTLLAHRRLGAAVLFYLGLGLSAPAVLAGQGSGQSNRTATTPAPGAVFQSAVEYDTGGALAWTVAVADVNGDGRPDLVTVNYDSSGDGSVAVLLNVGLGKFHRNAVYDSGGGGSSGIAVGDLNGDGKPDVVIANQGCPTIGADCVGVLLGNGDGTFQPAAVYADDGQSWASGEGLFLPLYIADVNGDGKPDIIVVAQTDVNYGDGRVGVLLGNGDGTFQPVVTYSSGGFAAYAAVVADVNGDGKLDVVVFNCAPHGTASCTSTRGTIGVLLGNGDGTFQPVKTYSSGGLGGGSALLVTDVNGDGKPDIVVGNYCPGNCTGNGSFAVLLNRGNGSFNPPVTYSIGIGDAVSIAAGDLNGDGNLDLVIMGGPVGAEIWLGKGDGSFHKFHSYSGGSYQVLLADLNGDGKLDLLAVNNTSGTADVRLGKGDGTFGGMQSYTIGGPEFSWVVMADVNGDGRPDLISADWCNIRCRSGDGSVDVLSNTR